MQGLWNLAGRLLGHHLKDSENFTHFHTFLHTLFIHFGLYWQFFSQCQQAGCLNASTWAGKLISNTFTHFQTILHTLTHSSHIFHTLRAILANICSISICWVSKSMYMSWKTYWWSFQTISHTPSHTLTSFSHNLGYFGPISANFYKLFL